MGSTWVRAADQLIGRFDHRAQALADGLVAPLRQHALRHIARDADHPRALPARIMQRDFTGRQPARPPVGCGVVLHPIEQGLPRAEEFPFFVQI